MKRSTWDMTQTGLLVVAIGALAFQQNSRRHIDAQSLSIRDAEGRVRVGVEASATGSFMRFFDHAGNERLVLGCTAGQDRSGDDEVLIELRMKRQDGSDSIVASHEDDKHHGDRQSISFSYGGDGNVDRLRLSSLWFGLEDGAELLMKNRNGKSVFRATTGIMASRPSVELRTFESAGVDESTATVERWLQLGQVSGLDQWPDALGVFAGQGSSWSGLGVGGEAAAFVTAGDSRGSAALVPGR